MKFGLHVCGLGEQGTPIVVSGNFTFFQIFTILSVFLHALQLFCRPLHPKAVKLCQVMLVKANESLVNCILFPERVWGRSCYRTASGVKGRGGRK